MASVSERLALILDFNGDTAIKGLEGVAKKSENAHESTRKLEDSLTKMGATGLAVAGVAAVGLGKLASGASDLNETLSKSRVIFGDAADDVEAFGDSAAKSLGQSKQQAIDAASTFGTMGKVAGMTGADLAQFSTKLVGLSGDLASFANSSPEEAVQAIGAALRGEAEPIRRFGVLLDDATLKNRALSMGLIETTTGTLPPAIKVQAAYAEILAQTTDAQGDFARTADGAANQQRILKAELKNLADGIGAGLLPAFTGIVSGGAAVIGKLNEMSPAAKQALGTFAAGGTATVAAISGISLITGQVLKLRDRFTEVEDGARSLTTAGKLGIGAAVGVGVFALAVQSMEERAAKARKRVDDLASSMKEFGITAEQAAGRKLIELATSSKKFDDALAGAGLTVEDVAKAVGGSREEYDKTRAALEAFIGKMERTGQATGDGVVQARQLIVEMRQQRIAADEVNAATARKAEADMKAAQIERDKTLTTEQASLAARAVAVETDKAAKAIVDAKDAAEKAEKADKAQAKAMEELAKAADKARLAELGLLNTTEDLYTATLDLDEKIDNFGTKLDDYHEAHKKTTEAIKAHGAASSEAAEAARAEEDAVRNAQREVASIAKAASDAAEKQATLSGKTFTVEDAAQAQRRALEELRKKYPEASGAIDDFIKKGIDPVIARSEEARLAIQASAAAAAQAWIDAGRAIPGFEARTRTGGGAIVAGLNIQPGSVATVQGFEPAMGAAGGGGSGATVRVVLEAGSGVVFLSAEAGGKIADALTLYTQRNGTAWLRSLGVTTT